MPQLSADMKEDLWRVIIPTSGVTADKSTAAISAQTSAMHSFRFETLAIKWNPLINHDPSHKCEGATKPVNGQC